MRLNAFIHQQGTLSADDQSSMFNLHSRYYDNLHMTMFMADLAEKHWVILLRTDDGGIAGFSTVQRLDLDIDGHAHRFLFSGDTIVDPCFWFESQLAGAFGHLMLHEIAASGDRNLHWFLICKGFRTYRFLPVYFREFYPRFDRPTPADISLVLNSVAQHKFPESFELDSGLIRLAGTKDKLCNPLCAVPEGRVKNPHTAYFLERNPQFSQGDELACLAEITVANLKESALRVLNRCEVEWCD